MASQESAPVNSMMAKFQQIEYNFNKNFLIIAFQLREIVEDEKDPKDVRQFELLDASYTHWYTVLQENPKNTDACKFFYDAVKDYHELLMKRDSQIFTLNGDFFSNIFNQKGIDTPYLFDCLRSGLDEDEEIVVEEEKDAKENLWNSVIALYRLCVLIMIYMKNDLIRDIIDMILSANPDITQHNIFEKIFTEFKSKKRLRKMIMKLLKSDQDSFGDIFTSLQKVIATFSSEVNVDMNMQKNVDVAKKKVRDAFANILQESSVKNLDAIATEQLIEALEENKTSVLEDFVEEKRVTSEQMKTIQRLYKAKGLNMGKTIKDLGSTMSSLMSALEGGDEDAVKKVLENAGSNLNMNSAEMEKMQSELENFEKEMDEDEENDDSKE